MSFIAELKRRNVIRMAGLYLVGAWLLVQVAQTLLPAFDVPGWVLRAIVIVLALGIVPAVVFAWVYELTPEGIKRDTDVLPQDSIATTTGRRMERLILVGLAAVIALVAADRFWPREGAAPARAAATPGTSGQVAIASQSGLVAVLPFRNRSVREEDAFFAEGIHDDLLTQLSKIASLKVISRTSMQRYADSEKSVPEIALELGAAVVLEGAVQRSGDQVRITVQLIDGASDVHLWAETYDRELTAETLFAIQAEIARAITGSLQVVLTPAEAASLAAGSTQSTPAYEAYLRGLLLGEYVGLSVERLAQSVASFDQAIVLDPGFADAHARKARAQLGLHWYFGESGGREGAAVSLAQAQRLAPDSIETWLAEAYYHYWGRLDYVRAEEALARLLARSPEHVEALLARAFVARRDGRFEDAVTALRRVLEIDPVNIEALLDFGAVLSSLGEFKEAEERLGKARLLGGDAGGEFIMLGLARGDADAAWTARDERTKEVYVRYPFMAALSSRDPQRIAQSLSPAVWPERLRSNAGWPEAYALAQAQALVVTGKPAQAELRAIQARLQARDDPYPGGWSANGLYWPSLLPGLLGDLDGVRAAERDYLQNWPRDVYGSLDIRLDLAVAFARAGDPEAALGHLEAVAALFGPAFWLRFSLEPGLESLHPHPRWLAMKDDYERWAAERAP